MSHQAYIKTICSFWKRLKPWHDLIFMFSAIAIIVIALLIFFFGSHSFHPGSSEIPVGSYNMDTVPNPFPGLPKVQVMASSGTVTSPKSDWGAQESPTLQVNVNKLSSSTAK